MYVYFIAYYGNRNPRVYYTRKWKAIHDLKRYYLPYGPTKNHYRVYRMRCGDRLSSPVEVYCE